MMKIKNHLLYEFIPYVFLRSLNLCSYWLAKLPFNDSLSFLSFYSYQLCNDFNNNFWTVTFSSSTSSYIGFRLWLTRIFYAKSSSSISNSFTPLSTSPIFWSSFPYCRRSLCIVMWDLSYFFKANFRQFSKSYKHPWLLYFIDLTRLEQ